MQRFLSLNTLLAGLSAVLLTVGTAPDAAHAAELSRKQIKAISGATFEVVLQKSTEDHITYERELPLDLIPFSVRNDPYYSVGTAFAIGPNQWITAGHVFDLGHKSLRKIYRLRDHNGKVYDVDKILKYSMHRDFVVFSIKHPPHIKPLATSTKPSLNEKVYSVGNALGQGVVFRDGLYTSNTPEEENGEWQWIRFSAAASPGNSGGPLLDLHGRVIGIVIGKSQNENLNYALPIREVLNAKKGVADVNARVLYKIDNMPNKSGSDRLNKHYTLPKSYAELDRLMTRDLYQFGMQIQQDFFKREHDHVFPNGPESLPVLYSDYGRTMPGLLGMGEDGLWDAYPPSKTRTNEISGSGFVTYGALGSSDMVYFRRPDGVQTSALYKDSKLLMDTLLKGYPLYRTIASEKIRVVSMGKAAQEYSYTDRWGRKWLARIWDVHYADRQVALFALPVPGGFVGMIRIKPVSQMESHVDDLKVLTDFFCASYYGTLADWRELLAQPDILPQAFADIRIDFDYGKKFRYASKRVEFSYGASDMAITDNSDLQLKFGFFRDAGHVTWDVSQVVAGDSKNSSTFFTIARHMQPVQQLEDNYQSHWEKLTQRKYPYNKSAFFDNKRTLIGDVYGDDLSADQLARLPVVYTAFYGTDGNVEQKRVQTKLDHFMDQLKVIEGMQ